MKELKFKTVIKAYQYDELSDDRKALVNVAKEAVNLSYSPYSHFQVGAAIRMDDGTILRGANQENAAYPSGLCAERTVLFYANANYPTHAVKALAIAAFTNGAYTQTPTPPCGACRQVMIETESRFNQPMEIILYSESVIYVIESAAALLPLTFVKEDLLGIE